MQFKQVLATGTVLFAFQAMASPVAAGSGLLVSRKADDNCQNFIGSCFDNGCEGEFGDPNATIGTCTAGTFNGCPCEKCGNTNGACTDNGCEGVEGTCTAGQFQGCPCN